MDGQLQSLERLGDDEHADPADRRRGPADQTSSPDRRHFRHHQPRNGTEPKREERNVGYEGQQWYPSIVWPNRWIVLANVVVSP